MTMAKVLKGITFEVTHRFLSGLFGEDVHAKRISSLANATLGVVSSASLAVNTIGQGLALARGRLPKHAIKQVDRLLSNPGIDVDKLSKRWVAHAVGPRPKIVVAMDWTDFDAITRRPLCCRWSADMVARHPCCGSRETRQR